MNVFDIDTHWDVVCYLVTRWLYTQYKQKTTQSKLDWTKKGDTAL